MVVPWHWEKSSRSRFSSSIPVSGESWRKHAAAAATATMRALLLTFKFTAATAAAAVLVAIASSVHSHHLRNFSTKLPILINQQQQQQQQNFLASFPSFKNLTS